VLVEQARQKDAVVEAARDYFNSHQCEAEALCGGCREMHEALNTSPARAQDAR
jgi:hypothetical protein